MNGLEKTDFKILENGRLKMDILKKCLLTELTTKKDIRLIIAVGLQ